MEDEGGMRLTRRSSFWQCSFGPGLELSAMQFDGVCRSHESREIIARFRRDAKRAAAERNNEGMELFMGSEAFSCISHLIYDGAGHAGRRSFRPTRLKRYTTEITSTACNGVYLAMFLLL